MVTSAPPRASCPGRACQTPRWGLVPGGARPIIKRISPWLLPRTRAHWACNCCLQPPPAPRICPSPNVRAQHAYAREPPQRRMLPYASGIGAGRGAALDPARPAAALPDLGHGAPPEPCGSPRGAMAMCHDVGGVRRGQKENAKRLVCCNWDPELPLSCPEWPVGPGPAWEWRVATFRFLGQGYVCK